MPDPTKPARRPRNSLTVDAILDVSESVAKSGFERLTIRAVAAELGASPMALYRYFTTKDELVDALLNRVLGTFVEPTATDDWFADLHAFARSHHAMLSSQPWAIALLVMHPNPGLNALPIGEAALRIMARGGITGDDAVVAFSGILALNYGWASFVAARRGAASNGARPAAPNAQLTALYPLTAEVAEALSQYGSAAHLRTCSPAPACRNPRRNRHGGLSRVPGPDDVDGDQGHPQISHASEHAMQRCLVGDETGHDRRAIGLSGEGHRVEPVGPVCIQVSHEPDLVQRFHVVILAGQ